MKRLLSIFLSFILAAGLSMGAHAASAELIGSDDFDPYMGSGGKTVTRLVKAKKQNYRVTGIYYAAESKSELIYVNRARRDAGLHELKWDSKLEEPAIQRALEQYISFSHTRPDGSHWRTVDRYSNGENLALGVNTYFDAETVTDGWLNSPDHYSNIMGTNDASKYFVSMAAACVETDKGIIWVQMFHADTKANIEETEDFGTTPTAGGADSVTPAPAPASTTVTAKSIAADLSKAKATGAKVSLTLKATDKLPIDVLKAAADWGVKNKKAVSLTVPTPASTGKSNQGVFTMNPASFTKNKNAVKTGVYVEKSTVQSVRDSMSKKYPKAAFAVIKLEQSGSYGGTVNIGAKADLSGLDTKSLLFYTYDAKTGKLTKLDLGNAGYSIDKNKYLRFATSKGGYIIVTDKSL